MAEDSEREMGARHEKTRTSSMNTLSALSGRPVNSVFWGAPPSLVGTRTTSSSPAPIADSALIVPERTTIGFAAGAHDAGWCAKMSLWTTMRFVAMSQSRSHAPAASKIGFGTPAMYPGLRERQTLSHEQGSRLVGADGGRGSTHTFSHSSRLMSVA